MEVEISSKLIRLLNKKIKPFKKESYQSILDKIGKARFVIIGEATHSTHEFYQVREEITKQLIMHKDFF